MTRRKRGDKDRIDWIIKNKAEIFFWDGGVTVRNSRIYKSLRKAIDKAMEGK